MSFWNKSPLIRLFLSFVLGVLFAILFAIQSNSILYLLFPLVTLLSLVVLIPKLAIPYRKLWLFGLLVNTTFFLLGIQLTLLKTDRLSEAYYGTHVKGEATLYVRLVDPYIEKDKSLSSIVDVVAVKVDGAWVNTKGKLLVYLKKDKEAYSLEYGDGLLIQGSINNILAPQNPSEFNYKQFLSYRNISHQTYITKRDWTYVDHQPASVFRETAIHLRNNLLNIFKRNNITGDEFAVGSALLLGYKDQLDSSIVTAYSSSGAMHVLSVSGLHVGIVYVVFAWALGFLDKMKKGAMIKATLLLLFLCFYAFLTGLSPSVLRAATMFGFIAIAKAFNRHSNIYNTLAASAFLLLLINPYFIMEVGFQLSYIAVIGIVYLQPKIEGWFSPTYWLVDKAWLLISVSIAAQLATLPLVLYYFHTFPNYFLVSNLIVIPLSTLIIYFGIALLLFSKLTIVASFLAFVFKSSVGALNNVVQQIESFPYSTISGVSISAFEMWLLYGLLISVLCYFYYNKFSLVVVSAGLVVVLLGFQIIEQFQQTHQRKIVVYHIPKTTAVDFISGRKSVLFTNNSNVQIEKKLSYHVKSNWQERGIIAPTITSNNIKTKSLLVNGNVIQFHDKKVAIINSDNDNRARSYPLLLDYLIISKGNKSSIQEVIKQYNASLIVFDSSNPQYKVDKWKRECISLKQNYYSVLDEGALTINL